jgi:hypothetical protein
MTASDVQEKAHNFQWRNQFYFSCQGQTTISSPQQDKCETTNQGIGISLQCPSNAIWPFKIYLCQNNPFKMQPKFENEDIN